MGAEQSGDADHKHSDFSASGTKPNKLKHSKDIVFIIDQKYATTQEWYLSIYIWHIIDICL